MLYDAREALSWADLIYAIDLNGMNSSVSPLAQPVQANRPFKWLNWDAARVLDMLRGSYLFERDEKRIIQDPESLRASSIRQGSAWTAWANLRDVTQIQMNSSDHNPAIRVGASPTDSWELSTPQLAQFYVKGSARNHGQHGFIFSNANWDPYPMANEIEAFTIALANMDTAVAQRVIRFTSPFFTVVGRLRRVSGRTGTLPPHSGQRNRCRGADAGNPRTDQPRSARGQCADSECGGHADTDAPESHPGASRRRGYHRAAGGGLAHRHLLAGFTQNPESGPQFRRRRRPRYGPPFAPLCPSTALGASSAARPIHEIAATFIRSNAAASFYKDNAREPDTMPRHMTE